MNCSDANSDSSTIFSMPSLDMALATWMMIALIVFTISFEFFLHHVERQLLLHTHYLKILSKVYKELMILGFISFAILIVLQVLELSSATTETLEFVHVWFFFIAVLYAIHVLVYMWLARRDKRRYDVAACMRIPDLIEQYKQVQAEEETRQQRPGCWAAMARHWHRLCQVSFVSSVWSSVYQSRSTRVYQQLQFHIVRSLFIRTYGLKAEFDFAKYLRRCMSKHITEQLDIKEGSWLMLIVFLVINVIRVEIEQLYGDADYAVVTLWLFLVVPYFLLGIGALAVFGIEKAKTALMAKVGVETAADLAQALLRSRTAITSSAAAASDSFQSNAAKAKRASVIISSQQQALDAYLPLLLSGLFPYNKPWLFTKALEVVMLTQCFFIGLACIFHIRQAFADFSAPIAALYVLFTMLPHLLVLLLIAPHVMTQFVFVHAVGYVNRDSLQHVSEYMADCELLRADIQHYLQQYCLTSNTSVTALFLTLSKDSNYIPVQSLRSLLDSVGIRLTASQTSRLRRMVNLQQDGRIDLREFMLFFFGSQGNESLSLVPIRANTAGQLQMISERQRDGIMEAEIRREQEKLQARDDEAVTVIEVADSSSPLTVKEAHFHPNALHDPESPHPHAQLPSSPAAVTGALLPHSLHSNTPTSPQSLHSPVSLPGLDLRHMGQQKAGEQNVFIAHTLDGGAAAASSSHSHHHHHHHPHHHKQVGLSSVDALDFAACFHGSEAVCQRCGQPVLVRNVNTHVQQCKLRPGQSIANTAAGDMAAELDRLRGGSVPYRMAGESEMAGREGADRGAAPPAAAAVTMDDIVLNDSRGGSRRSTRMSGRALPLKVKGDKVELDTVAEAKPSSKRRTKTKLTEIPKVKPAAAERITEVPPVAVAGRQRVLSSRRRNSGV